MKNSIGFVGEGGPLTTFQKSTLKHYFAAYEPGVIHFSGSIGADGNVYELLLNTGWTFEMHPHLRTIKSTIILAEVEHERVPSETFWQDIMRASDRVVAASSSFARSPVRPVWAIIDRCNQLGIDVTVVYPNGCTGNGKKQGEQRRYKPGCYKQLTDREFAWSSDTRKTRL